jgi:hypothetical protein
VRVYGLSELQIIATGRALGVYPEWRRYGGRKADDEHNLALRPLGERYAVLLEEEEDTPAQRVVCQHGHEAFIRALLEAGARLVTTPLARYTSIMQMDAIQPAVRETYLERYGEDPCECE